MDKLGAFKNLLNDWAQRIVIGGMTSIWRQVYLECSVYFGFPSMREIDLLE